MSGPRPRRSSTTWMRSSTSTWILARPTRTPNASGISLSRTMGLPRIGGGAKVFCNPPYGREISTWVRKCYEEARKPDTLVVMLLPARTDTKWFWDYIYYKAEIRFIKGRLHFNESKQSAPFPSMIVIFRSQQ